MGISGTFLPGDGRLGRLTSQSRRGLVAAQGGLAVTRTRDTDGEGTEANACSRLVDFVATVAAKDQQLGDWLQLALAAFFAGEATPIRYNPTDGDELAEQERRRKRLEDLGETKTQGGIGG